MLEKKVLPPNLGMQRKFGNDIKNIYDPVFNAWANCRVI